MIIETMCCGPFDTNAYLVVCLNTKKAIVIDPSPGSASKIFSAIQKHGVTLEAIYLTHSHFDHIADVSVVKKIKDVPVFIHGEDIQNLMVPGSDRIPCFCKVEGCNPSGLLKDRDIRKVGLLEFLVIHTPGHSPGSICFYFEKEKVLFSGDTLFKGSIGSLSLPTSQEERMWDSLKKLEVLPKETKVYPGHGSPTTIGLETWLKKAKETFG